MGVFAMVFAAGAAVAGCMLYSLYGAVTTFYRHRDPEAAVLDRAQFLERDLVLVRTNQVVLKQKCLHTQTLSNSLLGELAHMEMGHVRHLEKLETVLQTEQQKNRLLKQRLQTIYERPEVEQAALAGEMMPSTTPTPLLEE